MNRPKDEIIQGIGLNQELENAVILIKAGLAVLQNRQQYKRQHIVFLTLLANGLERLLKITLILRTIETEGRILTRDELRGISHNLLEARDRVVNTCYTPEYLRHQFAVVDLEFIREDELVQRLLALLSDFGGGGRYTYMDSISHPENAAPGLDHRWDDLEIMAMSEQDRILLMGDQSNEAVKNATNCLVIQVERFVRGLARLFLFAELGNEAKRLASSIRDFARLDDDDLGKRKYQL